VDEVGTTRDGAAPRMAYFHAAPMNDVADRITSAPAISPAERMLRGDWLSAIERSPSGSPLVWPEFVARQGRSVRIIDVREADELIGPLGHIPGAEWIPRERAPSLLERLPIDAKVVLVSRAGERSAPLAKQLEAAGMRFVASMIGGMVSWKFLGFHIVRDASILGRRDQLRAWHDAPATEGPLSLSSIEAHIGAPEAVRWMKLAALMLHGRLACVDGRDETGVIGTPGGDSGELLLALAAVERVTGHKLSPLAIGELFARRLETFGRFYLHGDVQASNELIAAIRGDRRFDGAIANLSESMQWRRFLNAPPVHLRDALLEHIVSPAHIGCGHLRLALTMADHYGARPALTHALIEAFFRTRWAGDADTEFTILGGAHQEAAVVRVHVEERLRSFTRVPLVSPTVNGTQIFVAHPQVAEHLRAELAQFLILQRDVLELGDGHVPSLIDEMRRLGEMQLQTTLRNLARGLPIYDVRFTQKGAFHVEAAGAVS